MSKHKPSMTELTALNIVYTASGLLDFWLKHPTIAKASCLQHTLKNSTKDEQEEELNETNLDT